MSECVVRMERVPKNCDDECWGRLSGECPWCESIDGYKMVGNRPPNCPIIAVLPEGHGRLADINGVFLAMVKRGQQSNRYKLDEMWELNGLEIQEALKTVPTIVPAERSEEK